MGVIMHGQAEATEATLMTTVNSIRNTLREALDKVRQLRTQLYGPIPEDAGVEAPVASNVSATALGCQGLAQTMLQELDGLTQLIGVAE